MKALLLASLLFPISTLSLAPPVACRILNPPSHLTPAELEALFTSRGFRVVSSEAEARTAVTYSYTPATSMFALRSSSAAPSLPRFIPSLSSEENLLRDRGWTFLDEEAEDSGPPGS